MISLGPRRLAVIAAATLTALVASVCGAVAAAADAPAAPVVTIVSPTSDSQVAGTVTFTVSIDQPDAAHPVNDVYLEIYGGNDTRQTKNITVAGDECDPTCTISADFDTKTFVVPTLDLTGYLPDLRDGIAELGATVGTSFGPTGFAHEYVDLENHRPVLRTPDLYDEATGASTEWTGIGTMSTRVTTALDPQGGTSISGFQLIIPHAPSRPMPDLTVVGPSDGSGTGTISVDTSKVSPGTYSGLLVATDSLGVTSALVPVGIVVPDAYQITARVDSATTDSARITVTPRWLDRSTAEQTWLTSVSVYQDGALLGTADDFAAPHSAATVEVAGPNGGSFGPADNVLTITAVDNRGIERAVTQNVVTTNPLTATWTMADHIVAGSPSGIGVSVTDTSQSQIAQIVVAIDGVRTAAIADPRSTLGVQVPDVVSVAPGLHDVTATVALTNGQHYVLHHPVTSYGHVNVTLSAPANATWGSTSRFRASLGMQGHVQPGALLQVQSRSAGSSAWVTRASTRTDATGVATYAIAVSRTGTASWRIVSPAAGYRLSGASPVRTVTATARFGRLPATSTVRSRHTRRFSLSIAPRLTGTTSTIQYLAPGHSTWATLTHAGVSSTGYATFAVRLARQGWYQLRVVTPSTRSVASTISRAWRLRVVA